MEQVAAYSRSRWSDVNWWIQPQLWTLVWRGSMVSYTQPQCNWYFWMCWSFVFLFYSECVGVLFYFFSLWSCACFSAVMWETMTRLKWKMRAKKSTIHNVGGGDHCRAGIMWSHMSFHDQKKTHDYFFIYFYRWY